MNLVIRSRPLALLLAAALVAPATASTAWATSTTPASALRTAPADTASTAASSSPATTSAPSDAQPENRVRARALGSGHHFVRQAGAPGGLSSGIGVRRRCGCVGPTSYGKEHDQLTSLSYYGFRFYDRLTLTWTQADPLYRFVPDLAWDEPRRANLYSFSLNNPLKYYDPDGRDPEDDKRRDAGAGDPKPDQDAGAEKPVGPCSSDMVAGPDCFEGSGKEYCATWGCEDETVWRDTAIFGLSIGALFALPVAVVATAETLGTGAVAAGMGGLAPAAAGAGGGTVAVGATIGGTSVGAKGLLGLAAAGIGILMSQGQSGTGGDGPKSGSSKPSSRPDPRPPTPGNMSLKQFGKTMRWGRGNEAARAQIQHLTREGLQKSGVTKDIAKAWSEFYRNEVARNPANPSAAGRADLMEAALRLLK